MNSSDRIYNFECCENIVKIEKITLQDDIQKACDMTSDEKTLLLSHVIKTESEATVEESQQQHNVKRNDDNVHQEMDGSNNRIEMIVDQRDHLLHMSIRKDNSIERLQSEIHFLEMQLKSAVTAKSEALARLEAIEGKELNVSLKEKQMEVDAERIQNQIGNLTNDLNKSMSELMAVREDVLRANSQMEINSNEFTERLRLANSSICELTETNMMLQNKNEEYATKLNEQIDELSRLMMVYDDDLKSKAELIELYKANCDDHQAHIKDLEAAAVELRNLINETADECDSMKSKLDTCDEKYQKELDDKDETIGSLKQKLQHANDLLRSFQNENESENRMDNGAGKDIIGQVSLHDLDVTHFTKGVTMTEMYTKYCKVVHQLLKKEEDYNALEIEMKNLMEGVKDSAQKFHLQQLDNKKLKAANEEFTEEKKNLILAKVVTREKLKATLNRCEFLEKESKRSEMYANKYLQYLMNKSPGENVKSDAEDSQTGSQYVLTELKDQNQILLQVVHELLTTIDEMTVTESKINSEVSDLGDANVNLANRSKENTSLPNCHKSVGVTEDELMVDYRLANASFFTPKKNFLKIEEKLQNKVKELQELKQGYDMLQKENIELTAEKIQLSSDLKLSNTQNNGSSREIVSLKEQSKMYVTAICEQKTALKLLSDENKTSAQKLFIVESRCEHLQNECQKLSSTKNSLDVEVDLLKRELSKVKSSNKLLETKLEIVGESSKQLKTENVEMMIHRENLKKEVDRFQAIITGMTQRSTTDMSTQMEDTKPEDHDTFQITMVDETSQKKRKFLNSLKLMTAEKDESSALSPVATRKRKRRSHRLVSSSESHSKEYHMTLRSNKKPRLSYQGCSGRSRKRALRCDDGTGSPLTKIQSGIKVENEDVEDENEEINVGTEFDEDWIPPRELKSRNIELELRNEIRTRRQAQFLHDAFCNEDSQEEALIGKASTRKEDHHVVGKRRQLAYVSGRGNSSRGRGQSSHRGRGRCSGVGSHDTSVGNEIKTSVGDRGRRSRRERGRGRNVETSNFSQVM